MLPTWFASGGTSETTKEIKKESNDTKTDLQSMTSSMKNVVLSISGKNTEAKEENTPSRVKNSILSSLPTNNANSDVSMQNLSSCFPSLTHKQRIYGFATCLVTGYLITLMVSTKKMDTKINK